MKYELKLDGLPKTWNSFATKHWRVYKKYKDEIHWTIRGAIRGKHPHHMPNVRITFVVGFASYKKKYDIDSVCLKPHLDALVRANIIEDDDRKIVREVRVTWEKTQQDQLRIVLEPWKKLKSLMSSS